MRIHDVLRSDFQRMIDIAEGFLIADRCGVNDGITESELAFYGIRYSKMDMDLAAKYSKNPLVIFYDHDEPIRNASHMFLSNQTYSKKHTLPKSQLANNPQNFNYPLRRVSTEFFSERLRKLSPIVQRFVSEEDGYQKLLFEMYMTKDIVNSFFLPILHDQYMSGSKVNLDDITFLSAKEMVKRGEEGAFIVTQNDRIIIDQSLSSITPQEIEILQLRGFLNGKKHPYQFIANKMNVTRERIRQKEAKALTKLSRSNLGLESALEPASRKFVKSVLSQISS